MRGCVDEELIEEYLARPKVTLILGWPIEKPEALFIAVRNLRSRIEERTGGEAAWVKPAALEWDPERREILVRQRFELLAGIESTIEEVHRERHR